MLTTGFQIRSLVVGGGFLFVGQFRGPIIKQINLSSEDGTMTELDLGHRGTINSLILSGKTLFTASDNDIIEVIIPDIALSMSATITTKSSTKSRGVSRTSSSILLTKSADNEDGNGSQSARLSTQTGLLYVYIVGLALALPALVTTALIRAYFSRYTRKAAKSRRVLRLMSQ